MVGRLEGLALILPDLNASLGAVEGQMIALDRHEGVEGIGHDHLVLEAQHRRHGIGDVDVLAIDAAIAHIAVLARRILIEHGQPGILAHVEIEVAILGMDAGLAALAAKRPVAAVIALRSEGRDLAWHRVQIPVEQIEMMGGLVHEQAARMGFLGVPAAEIVGAMLGVEIPMEIDRGHGAHRLLAQQLLDAGGGGREAIVESHVDGPAGACLGFEDAAAFFRRGGHWLFGDHPAARLERLDDDLVMGVVTAADDDDLRLHARQHQVDIGVDGRIGADRGARGRGPHLVDIADRHELGPVAPALQQFLAPHARAAMTGADQGYPMPLGALLMSRRLHRHSVSSCGSGC